MADNTGRNGKQIAGYILLLVGPVGIIISFLFFEMGAKSLEDMPQLLFPLIGMLLVGISSLLFVVGIILLFVGRSQAKKQKNQNIPLA